MATEEQISLRKQLVSELRSGKYKQAKFKLYNGTGYCCLGIACLVAGLTPIKANTDPDTSIYLFGEDTDDKRMNSLPDSVKNKFGFSDNLGEYYVNENILTNLATQNDCGRSFDVIADLIESEPKGMFVE